MNIPFASAGASTETVAASASASVSVTSGAPVTPRDPRASRDPRALQILAKSIYRELRGGGLAEEDVMAIAGDLLGLVAGDVKDRRRIATENAPR